MLSLPHLIILFIVALIVFGPEKLPQLARDLGKAMAEFRRASAGLRSSLEDNLRELEREVETKRAEAPSQVVHEAVPAGPAPAAVSAPSTAGQESTENPADGHTTPA